MKVVPFDSDAHHAVQALLPWFAMNSLDDEERARVEEHLAGCPACRAELDLERKMQAALPRQADDSLASAADVEQGLARMRTLIGSGAPRPAPPAARWWRWALAAQFAVIVALGAALVLPEMDLGAHRYRALGAPGADAAANVVVMFKPEATEQEIRRALRESGARLVDGPTASNAWLLSVQGEGHVEAIARLRAQPAVSLAESLDARTAP